MDATRHVYICSLHAECLNHSNLILSMILHIHPQITVVKLYMWPGLQKQGMWVHDFVYVFNLSELISHNFLSQNTMAMKFSALSRNLFGISYDTGYRMKIFCSRTETWPLEKQDVVCAHVPCFCRPGHI